MLSIIKFHLQAYKGLRMDCDCACAKEPDTTALANASKESAEIMAQLGRDQLEEARRQYDKNMEVSQPVVDAQLDIMNQTKQQGEEQYAYQKGTFRPIEEKLAAEASEAGSAAQQEQAASKAVADVRSGNTNATNMAMRQAMRSGVSAAALGSKIGKMSASQASAEASAANGAREKEKSIGYAKRLDVAGIGRNLTGASQGAYGVAINSGNSAVNNSMAPGLQLMQGMGQGAATVGQGQQMYLGGLSNSVNADANYASQMNQQGKNDNTGAALGAVAGIAAAI